MTASRRRWRLQPENGANGEPAATGEVSAVVADQAAARRRESRIEQSGERHIDVIRVADVRVAVGVGEPGRLEVVEQRLDARL